MSVISSETPSNNCVSGEDFSGLLGLVEAVCLIAVSDTSTKRQRNAVWALRNLIVEKLLLLQHEMRESG